jgi:hypothetical protein
VRKLPAPHPDSSTWPCLIKAPMPTRHPPTHRPFLAGTSSSLLRQQPRHALAKAGARLGRHRLAAQAQNEQRPAQHRRLVSCACAMTPARRRPCSWRCLAGSSCRELEPTMPPCSARLLAPRCLRLPGVHLHRHLAGPECSVAHRATGQAAACVAPDAHRQAVGGKGCAGATGPAG